MISLRENIENLTKNIRRIQHRLDVMHAAEYGPPAHCCPSCYWGREMDEVVEALERRLHYRRVLLCRINNLKPEKTRLIEVKVDCCSGRTTLFSVGRCDCRDPRCPGRGICHTCRGTGKRWGKKKITTRHWPPNIREIEDENRMGLDN